jgi:hypothetical protein
MMTKISFMRFSWLLGSPTRLTWVGLLSLTIAASGQSPTPVVDSPRIPRDVSIPGGFNGNPIAFFDDYSWRTFIAVVWPALTGQRGQPDPNQMVDGAGPRVFETYKTLEEVFHSDGSAPSGWNQFDPAQYNSCGIAGGWGDLTLGSFSKFSNVGQAGFGNLVGPLIARNTTYVRYLTSYNQVEFDQIVAQKWYLRANLPGPSAGSITFNVGSLDLKSSWIDMTNIPHPERYYVRSAHLLDPLTGQCKLTNVGLVGLHIVQKTPSRPQWIWSSFEQVDNVPPAQPGAPGTFAFNDGTGTPMPVRNPYNLDQVLQDPTPPPFNVTRVKPIHPSTQATNQAYHEALSPNSVWRNYQLVMTQWPLVPNSPETPGTPQNTFPGTGATTAFANVTLETFDQNSPFTSCMACHTTTMRQTDFLWSLNDHAFPAKSATPNLLATSPSFRALKALIQTSRQESEKAALANPQK